MLFRSCVPANPIRPDLLPSQCESETQVDPTTGRKIQNFSQFAPRVSLTYDLFGNGKTSFHVSGAYYFATRITLANNLSGLTGAYLQWGANQSSGACSTTAPSTTGANQGASRRSRPMPVPVATAQATTSEIS